MEAEGANVARIKSASDNNEWEIELKAKRGKIKFKIDTGAEVTVIGTHQLKMFDTKITELNKSNKSLIGPDHKKLICHGWLKKLVKIGKIQTEIVIYVCMYVCMYAVLRRSLPQ